jgi:hypothetical protein
MADKKKFPGEVQFENTITSTGTNTHSGVNTFSGGINVSGGRIRESLEAHDADSQNHTITHTNVTKGLLIHTSVTGGGTLTMPDADKLIVDMAVPLSATNDTVILYYINDGGQTVTLANSTDGTTTVADTGQTVAANESGIILFQRTGADAVKAYLIGA